MTRFARAKGSKASNEKIREESTPWHVMKKQLEESSLNKDKLENKEKPKTARQLLEEKEKSAPAPNDWAEFDEPTKGKKTKLANGSKIEKSFEKKKKKKKLNDCLKKHAESNDDLLQNMSSKLKEKQKTDKNEHLEKHQKKDESLEKVEIKKKKPEKLKKKIDNSKTQLESSPKDKKRNKLNESSLEAVSAKKKKSENFDKIENSEETHTKATEKLSKRQKRNLKKKNQNAEAANKNSKKSVFDTEENDWSTEVKFGNSCKLDTKAEGNSGNNVQNRNNFARFERLKPNMKNHHLRKPKARDDKEHKRRKPLQCSKMMINGVEVEVTMYDGFPVQKEDAERLKELKQQMILKAIPKSEIEVAMKLERRKAEKALARVRKQVCFHCRKSGHNVAECPEVERDENVTGICFKCGSTEHTHFECKVTKSDDYRFAKCFICREQGHVARQCPDNPKGLYPKGGACNICGDVTHLKKDCPEAVQEKEEKTITVKTISDSVLESIDDEGSKKEPKKSKTKIVKF